MASRIAQGSNEHRVQARPAGGRCNELQSRLPCRSSSSECWQAGAQVERGSTSVAKRLPRADRGRRDGSYSCRGRYRSCRRRWVVRICVTWDVLLVLLNPPQDLTSCRAGARPGHPISGHRSLEYSNLMQIVVSGVASFAMSEPRSWAPGHVLSALVWAPLHVYPGVLLAMAVSFVGETAEHLILLLLAGLILASTVWGLKKSRLEEPGYSCCLSSLVVSSQLQVRSSVRRIQLKAFCDIKEFFTCSEQDVKASTLLIG